MTCNPRDDGTPSGASRPDADGRCVEFDPETESVVETIVHTVADLASVDPTALDPLYDVIDPDALDAVLRSVATRSNPGDLDVAIRYHGFAVTVHSYGVLEIAGGR